MLEYSQFWPVKGDDMRLKIRAYWKSLEDLDYLSLQKGLLDLSRELKYAPSASELREAAEPYRRKLLAAAGVEVDWLKTAEKKFNEKVRRCREKGEKFSFKREY